MQTGGAKGKNRPLPQPSDSIARGDRVQRNVPLMFLQIDQPQGWAQYVVKPGESGLSRQSTHRPFEVIPGYAQADISGAAAVRQQAVSSSA